MNGSNPAREDAKTKDAATECAEVFALSLRARAHIGTPNALLMPMALSDLSRRYADKTNHQSLN
jgi:hypothetical protein